MRFRLVAVIGAMTVVLSAASLFLVDRAIAAGEQIARDHAYDAALNQSTTAYRELFQARKEAFFADARAIAATWTGSVKNPALRFIRRWSVEPEGPSGDALDAFPSTDWREFEVQQPLPDGRKLRIEFVANRQRFREYDLLSTLPLRRQLWEPLQRRMRRTYLVMFVGAFAVLFAAHHFRLTIRRTPRGSVEISARASASVGAELNVFQNSAPR